MKNEYGFKQDNLEKLIEQSRMTLIQISNASGVSRSLLTGYLKNRLAPDIECAIRLADFFEVSVDCIIGRESFEKAMAKKESKIELEEKLVALSAIEAIKYRKDRIIIELGKLLERAEMLSNLFDE